jgi:hypothetical protein
MPRTSPASCPAVTRVRQLETAAAALAQRRHRRQNPTSTLLLQISRPGNSASCSRTSYTSARCALINIDFDVLTGMVSAQYNGKRPDRAEYRPEIGRNYARDYLDSPLTVQLRRSNAVGDRS